MKPTDLASRREGPREHLYRPAEVAKILSCSEWWIKEQARKRRIPYSWIGGSYRFTDDHVRQIVRLFEVQPAVGGPHIDDVPANPRRRTSRPVETVTELKARTPRRALKARQNSPTAA